MTAVQRGPLVSPSPIFYGLVTLLIALGFALRLDYRANGITLFFFVIVGWVLSLALHEFGHALLAYMGGDRSVVAKGYLTLDVRKYVDVKTSLLIPIFFLIIGGIGLPGGAVWINTGAIRSKMMRSLMSAAGPIASGLCALACLLPIRLGLIESPGIGLALSFLGWIQVIAMLFNLVPVPGLDGFGILEPHMSRKTLQAVQPMRQYAMLGLIAAIFFVPPVRDVFFGLTDTVTEMIGGDAVLGARGPAYLEFRFWE